MAARSPRGNLHTALSAGIKRWVAQQSFWGSLPRTIGRTNDEMRNMDMELLNHEEKIKTSIVPVTVITSDRE